MVPRDLNYQMPEIRGGVDPNQAVYDDQLKRLNNLVPLEFAADIFGLLPSPQSAGNVASISSGVGGISTGSVTFGDINHNYNSIFETISPDQIWDGSESFDELVVNVVNNNEDVAVGGGPKTATFVIGPSSNSDSDTYDYVTDGTDDESQINTAIGDLPADGGKIVLREGTYTVNADATFFAGVVVDKKNVTIEGMGRGTIIQPTATADLNQANIRLFYVNNVLGFRLDNVTLDGSNNSTDTVIGIQTNSTTHSTLTRVYFANINGDCVDSSNETETGTISRCFFKDWTADNAINTWGGAVNACRFENTSTSLKCIVSPTIVDSCYFEIASGYTTNYLSATNAAAITNNVFETLGALGSGAIIINSARGQIVGNKIIGSGGSVNAVGIFNSVEGTVSSNTIRDITGRAVVINLRNVCSSNVIEGCGRQAIDVDGGDCSITGNVIEDAGKETNDTYAAINISGSTDRCVVTGNRIRSNAANKHKYGIRVNSGATNNNVSANVVTDAVTANVSDAGTGTVTDGSNVTS